MTIALSIYAIATAWQTYAFIAAVVYQRKKANKAKRAAQAAADAAKGFQVSAEGEMTSVNVVYGRSKIAGARVYHNLSDNFIYADNAEGGKSFVNVGDLTQEGLMRTSVPMTDMSVALWENTIYNPETYVTSYEYSTEQQIGEYDGASWPLGHPINFLFSVNKDLVKINATTYSLDISDITTNSDKILVGAIITITQENLDSPFYWSSIKSKTPIKFINMTYKILSNNGTIITIERSDLTKEGMSDNITGNRKEFLFINQVICSKGVNDIIAVEVNQLDWRHPDFGDSMRIHAYTEDMIVDPMILANFPEQEFMKFPGTAHASMVFKLNRDDPQYQGIPNVAFYLEGKKVKSIIPPS